MNLKHSRQRDSIKKFLATRKDHPTADIVYMGVRRTFPNIISIMILRLIIILSVQSADASGIWSCPLHRA